MKGVAQQRDGPGPDDHDCLGGCGQREDAEADPQGTAPVGVRLQRGVDLIGNIVGVPTEEVRRCVPGAGPAGERRRSVLVVVLVVVGAVVRMVMPMVVVVWMRMVVGMAVPMTVHPLILPESPAHRTGLTMCRYVPVAMTTGRR